MDYLASNVDECLALLGLDETSSGSGSALENRIKSVERSARVFDSGIDKFSVIRLCSASCESHFDSDNGEAGLV